MILVLTLFIMGYFSSLTLPVFPQESESNNIILFVPQKMIVGESYYGMVTLLSPSPNNSLVLLSVDDDFVVQIDSSVNIQTNKNHGIFKLTPLHEGEATVSILHDGELLSAQTKVFSKKSDAQKLKVILPVNSTITTNMKGMVFLLDGNDSPIQSSFDRIISLVTSEKIFTPNSVTIYNGSSYAIFPVVVKATGEITAIAPQLESYTTSIEKSQNIINVKLGIAPNIILEESYTNYFIWLEKDGLPYTIQGVQKVEIQTSNSDVVRLGVSPASYKNENSIITSMYDGMAKGRLYTGDKGIAEISVSIPNYGHTFSTVYVGATILGNSESDSENKSENLSIENYADLYTDSDINYIQLQVYPDVTDDYAYGVASLYHMEQTEEIEITVNDDDIQISNNVIQTVLVPVYAEDLQISISSQKGLEHNSSYLLNDVSFLTHSKIFEITANSVGNYTITATGGNSYDTAPLLVTTNHNSLYSIHITELPILSHFTQPLFMVSIINENDKLIDVPELFGKLISINLYSTNGIISSSHVTFDDNVAIIHGLFTGVGDVIVSSSIFGVATNSVIPSGVPISLELLTPDMVHAGEAFPIIIHEIDAKGIPLSKKDVTTVSSSGFDVIDSNNNMISVSGIGEQNISILSGLGGGYQRYVESFVNEMDYTVNIDNHTPRIGETVTIKITSQTKDVTYNIDSPFPYEKINSDIFEITPDHEINGIITVIGKLDGFGTLTKQISISSSSLVEISVDANTINGDIITSKYVIKLQDSELIHSTPHTITISPQPIVLEIDKDLKTVTSGYKLVELSINEKIIQGNVIEFYADSDKKITAIYDKFISVIVNDGVGSGVYSYGDTITISAPDKPIISFLVKETFDYWEGIDKESSSFVILADKDIQITAMYKDDYTILMGIILVGIIGIVIFVIKNGDNQLKYRFEDIAEKIIPVIKRCIPSFTRIKIKKSKDTSQPLS